jgi:two-component system response regulator AtoC
MSFPLQAKLLQVLQDGEFARLGGKADVHVDVRVIAATNRNLETAVADGQFREDLYFRLNVVTINLPPLRERRDEIPVLVDHFLKKYSVQYNKPLSSITDHLAQEFMRYDWPGNVRQLENLIKRMIVLGTEQPIFKELQQPREPLQFRTHAVVAPVAVAAAVAAPAASAVAADTAINGKPASVAAISPSPFPTAADGSVSLKDISRTAAREAERELILRMLTRTRWNRKEAAEILGISYKALLYKIKENGLDKAS